MGLGGKTFTRRVNNAMQTAKRQFDGCSEESSGPSTRDRHHGGISEEKNHAHVAEVRSLLMPFRG